MTINRNKILTAKLIKQGYRYHKLCMAFSKFDRSNYELTGFNTCLKKGISEPRLYQFTNIFGITFNKIVICFQRKWYNVNGAMILQN